MNSTASFMYLMKLTKNVFLRVRQPGYHINGSILLQTVDESAVWDCKECKEWSEVCHLDENWLQMYTLVQGVKDEEEAKQDETRYTYKNLRKLNTLGMISANNCKLSITKDPKSKIKIIHSLWNPADGSLELFLSEDVKRDNATVVGTEYTSMLLMFERVVFEITPRSPKRIKTDQTP